MLSALEAEAVGRSLEEEMAGLCGVLNAVTAELVSKVAVALETDAWQGAGIKDAAHWVSWKCGVTRRRAESLVHMASRLSELPVTKGYFEEGELSEDQVRIVAHHTPAHNDAEVAEFARLATVSQLQHTLGRYPFQGKKPERQEQRQVSFGSRSEGTWSLRADLEPDQGAVLEAALQAERDLLFAEAEGSPVSWADALVGMAHRYLDPERPGAPHRYQVLVHVGGEDGESNLHLGPALTERQRRLLDCDAALRWVLEQDGIPVSYGRSRRTVPTVLRALVEERDRGCRVPGCAQRRWLVVHHLRHWEDGGLTVLENLCCLCPAHHRLHHLGRLGIEGDPTRPDGLVFTDPLSGCVLDPCGKPRPPNRPPREAAEDLGVHASRYTPPLHERMDARFLYFTEAPSSN